MQPLPFGGPSSVYGTSGTYTWGGKKSCGLASGGNGGNVCTYTLRPQGPAPDATTTTGLAGNGKIPNLGKCAGSGSAAAGADMGDLSDLGF